MEQKTQQIFIPPTIGLLFAFLISLLLELGLEKFYFPFDPDSTFSLSFSLYFYSLAFIPILLFASAFQFFFALRIWKTYSECKKILNLSLGQLIIMSSLVFGVIIALLTWNNILGIENFILKSLRIILFSITYWTCNVYSAKFIKQRQNGR